MAARAKTKKTTRKTTRREVFVTRTNDVVAVNESIIRRVSGAKYIVLFIIILAVALVAFRYRRLLIAATVNGEAITRISVIKELERQGGSQALEALVAEALVYQEAGKQNVRVEDSEIDGEVKRIEETVLAQGQKLDDLLSFQGLTREDFTRRLRVQLLSEKLLGDKLKVTQEEIDQYIKDNKDTFDPALSEDRLKQQVEEFLRQGKFNTDFTPWLDTLKASAKIEYLVKY
ncbi:hypothetical protein A3D84_04650 [Candidatus Woesebacteria bacterium RIFCSPHIGHO2_02_FULL_42_20]|uniref:PpiC domain-containing protein n=1 Tax=Candidatus Woesebacteria bacterium RIFCSPHIGHO2_12_FULL_41_24 TaxID=1802510 RepID=A0A1F8AS62_9BACT|nr:MAG: hypothetical protein A2W15_06240 [Candidatus Woesebacteria bacterium RBG_16_41_13]OGM34469.1 MAG: hypothetical protein A3D84_04650 [Candidatus Woesebacteria bacterium RIFCSPHIGHO2_02_FULL_42_20]OGM54108.1 MAG: hypothetical protein A3E44_02810 [Candidatus Woesebacteria bacterium RIFCSPHIGHO2_12_FULL_41_24]OGM67371.1 MAG: hypothetical protein A2969_02930 [Candidatus Woesebacteria bacterium RIFCSPLOWO2_01_FULL_42_67]